MSSRISIQGWVGLSTHKCCDMTAQYTYTHAPETGLLAIYTCGCLPTAVATALCKISHHPYNMCVESKTTNTYTYLCCGINNNVYFISRVTPQDKQGY